MSDETPTPEETRKLLGVEDSGQDGQLVDLADYTSEGEQEAEVEYEDPRKIAFQETLGEHEVSVIPAIIILADGREYECDDLRSWGYCALGLWGFGRFSDEGEDVEHLRIFPVEKIEGVELQWDGFERLLLNHAEVLSEDGVSLSD